MNCNTTHYRANSSSVPGDPTPLALDSGDRLHACIALSLEGAYTCVTGDLARGKAILGRADALAAELGDPIAAAYVAGGKSTAHYAAAEWGPTLARALEAQALLRRHSTGGWWELSLMETWGLAARCYLGRLRELADKVPPLLAAARERGDLFGLLLSTTGVTALSWLARDDPSTGMQIADSVMARWPDGQYAVPHYWHFLGRGQQLLYEADAAAAQRHLRTGWPALQRAQLLRVITIRTELLDLRGRSALAAATTAPADAAGHLRSARADAARLLARSVPAADALGRMILAGASAATGRREAATAELERALRAAEIAGMELHAACARHRLAALVGGDRGALLRTAAADWMSQQGVVRPERMLALIAPGFPAD